MPINDNVPNLNSFVPLPNSPYTSNNWKELTGIPMYHPLYMVVNNYNGVLAGIFTSDIEAARFRVKINELYPETHKPGHKYRIELCRSFDSLESCESYLNLIGSTMLKPDPLEDQDHVD